MTENDNPFVSAEEPTPENHGAAADSAAGETVASDNAGEPPVDGMAGEEGPPVDPLVALQGEADQWKHRYLRSQADLDNYRKRMAREMGDARRYANADLIEDLLPVLDNFHLGLDAARNAEDGAGILLGMEMVCKQIEEFLVAQGVDNLELEIGAEFDPTIHEAVAQEPDAGVPEGKVLKEVRRGYKMGERLLRPANVIVSTGPAGVPQA